MIDSHQDTNKFGTTYNEAEMQQMQDKPPQIDIQPWLLQTPYVHAILSGAFYADPDDDIAEASISVIADQISTMDKDKKAQLAATGVFNDFAQILALKPESEVAENICMITTAILKESPESVYYALYADLLAPLLIILNGPLEKVKHIHTHCLFSFAFNTKPEHVNELVDRGALKTLVRLLEIDTNQDVINDVIGTIHNIILLGKDRTKFTDPHPYFMQLEALNGLAKIIEVHDREPTEFAVYHAALAIGRVFRTVRVPVQFLHVIDTLKDIVISASKALIQSRERDKGQSSTMYIDNTGQSNNPSPWLVENAISALRALATNEVNHPRLIENEFIPQLSTLLESRHDTIVQNTLIFLQTMYKLGDTDTMLTIRRSAANTTCLALIKKLTAQNLPKAVTINARNLLTILQSDQF